MMSEFTCFVHSFSRSFIHIIRSLVNSHADGRSLKDEEVYDETGEGEGGDGGAGCKNEKGYRREEGREERWKGGGGGNDDEGMVMEEAIGELYAFLVTESNILLNSMHAQTTAHRYTYYLIFSCITHAYSHVHSYYF